MSTQTPRTRTIDITELGFDAPASASIGILIEKTDDGSTFIEATYEEFVWTLEFDQYGQLTDGPTRSAPSFVHPYLPILSEQIQKHLVSTSW